jgi:flavin-binding protein dodecin
MTKQSTKKIDLMCGPKKNKWEEALNDALARLANARKEVYEWKAVVRGCKQRIAEGAPWPGEHTNSKNSGGPSAQ